MNDSAPSPSAAANASGQYVVVARRYRPQSFDELIGQEHVAKALKGAIESDRVGHAYLFTGARGVGKTSAARILAKALDCIHGPTPTPCNECEICRSISSGDDVDVLEIDGASNRGIDEIRQLRQNVAVRPARARFKIYIIDEVHMLTKEAFNALLKTLEEPPEHVKFIFATTEPNKIPITILSRCQRFDFAGIDAGAIHQRLSQIAAAEGVEVEPDALQIIAMRAAGSMRDSQSLLEQLLSTGDRNITAADVTNLLGLAPAARLSRLVEPLVQRNASAALAELDAAIAEGAEVGQLMDQLLGYFRDVMVQAVGGGANQLLYALPGQRGEIQAVAEELGIQTLLAISQILDQTAARMRMSTQVRTLAEMALVRICHLQDLDEISTLIEQLKSGESPASGAASKKNEPVRQPAAASGQQPLANGQQPRALPGGKPKAPSSAATIGNYPRPKAGATVAPEAGAAVAPASYGRKLDGESAEAVWRQALEKLTGIAADCAACATKLSVDNLGRLVASFPESQKFSRDTCLRPSNLSRIESAISEVCGGRVGLVLATHHEPADAANAPSTATPRKSVMQQQVDVAAEPFVQRAVELFDGDSSRLRYVAPNNDARGN
jgi:DNA polymerase-3 subunit gamma/tau